MTRSNDTTHALVTTTPSSSEMDTIARMGVALAKAGFWSDARNPEAAAAKILVGRDLGIPPTQALSNVYIVKGKPVIGASILAGLVKRHPNYNYRIIKHDDQVCHLDFFENGEKCGESIFTIAKAKRAGLMKNPTWKSYPENMLFARAMSNGVRWHCPDVTGGAVYTPGELGEKVEVDPQTGDAQVIEAEVADDFSAEPGWQEAYKQFKEALAEKDLSGDECDLLERASAAKRKVSSLTELRASTLVEITNGLKNTPKAKLKTAAKKLSAKEAAS